MAISFNKGEWSEVYGVLFLLIKPKVKLVDENLQLLTDSLYRITEVNVGKEFDLNYRIVDNYVLLYIDGKCANKMSISKIEQVRTEMLNEIMNYSDSAGSFEIPSLEEFLQSFSNGRVIKAKSGSKADLILLVNDDRIGKNIALSYSIKSSLGSSATILNASKKTDFKYFVDGLSDYQIDQINKIETRDKIKDRISKIYEFGGKIKFSNVKAETFDYNLRMVDSNMPTYLGNALLESYRSEKKHLKEVFLSANNFDDKKLGIKKLGDLLSSISFGFVPGKKWNGINTTNGGLVIVKEDGDVVVLDLIYYADSVHKYIVNESKLDTPSSTRYHMAELRKEKNIISFTLNLQIRFK